MPSKVGFLFIKDALGLQCCFYFCFQLWRNSETNKKTKHLEKNEIKKQLLDSKAINNAVEIEEVNERAEKIEKPEDAVHIIMEYEEVLRAKKRESLRLRIIKEKFSNALKKKRSFKKWQES